MRPIIKPIFGEIRIFRGLLAITLGLAGLVRAPALPPPLGLHGEFGINIHRNTLLHGDLGRIRDAGFTWIRVDFNWSKTETTRGHYDFSSYDSLFADAEAHGMRPLVILNYGNPLYAEPGEKFPYVNRVQTVEYRRAFAAWADATVRHYAGRGYLWECWNEPNFKGFWAPKPDSAAYVALMRPACAAIRRSCPNEIVIGPAGAGIDLKYIEGCLQGGMLQYWSAISVHPYRRANPESAEKDLTQLRNLIARYAAPGQEVPVIFGEWGYSTAWPGFTDNKQADCLRRMVAFSRRENIPLTIWYDWRDDGDDPKDPEHHFGLVYRSTLSSFKPKPAYAAARQLLGGGPAAGSGSMR